MLTVGSLFTGIGGIDLGLERTGRFKISWMVEVDEFCRRILKKHWPEVPCYGDIRAVDWSAVPRVDMLCGGFPCQDISCANPHGKGIEGARSGLWKEYARAIGVLRPRYALVENVPALVRKGLDVVLADLASLGYDAEWINLSASDVGAPHRRERVFIVAKPADIGRLGSAGGLGLPGQQRQQGDDVEAVGKAAAADNDSSRLGRGYREKHCLAGKGGWKLKDKLYHHRDALLPTIGAHDSKGSHRPSFRGAKVSHCLKMSEGLRTSRADPIYLNPCFAEAVMGFEIGWTELEASATPSSRTAPSSSANSSPTSTAKETEGA